MNNIGTDHNDEHNSTDEYYNPPECEDIIRCDIFLYFVYV
jgi:hypothetical protein